MKIKSKILNLACSVAVGSLFVNAISAQERVLNVTNWGEYIAEDTISNFENEYGMSNAKPRLISSDPMSMLPSI